MFLFTVFLLAIIAWLFFNGMNEKRWVEAHSHDESVASDPGFLPNFSSVSRSMGMGEKTEGKVSIDQENTSFARAVASVKRRTAKYSDGLEKRAAAARVDDASRPRSAADESDFFGRMVKRVGGFTRKMDAGVDRRMQSGRTAGEEQSSRGGNMAASASAFERTAAKIGAQDEALGDRMTKKFNERTAPDGQTRKAAEEGGLFNAMVGKVSGGLEVLERKVDERLAKSRVDPADRDNPKSDDFIGRMSTKIGARIDDLNERLVYPNKLADRRGGTEDSTNAESKDNNPPAT